MSADLIVIGASARAAAFSALRAGLRPWCVDLFADSDLKARCPALALPAREYPDGFVKVLRQAPVVPWLYTGGLENRSRLVRKLAELRPLWGNDAGVLASARSPSKVQKLLWARGIPCPQVCLDAHEVPAHGWWLVKPRNGAGGVGIRFWRHEEDMSRQQKPVYLQEYIEGEACAAIYVGDGRAARLLGATRQLVGETWLHAAPFHYCGSIGPLCLTPPVREALACLGEALTRGCGLRGLFGVDCVVIAGIPWPVDFNPRYTASVEVLEYATGIPALALHRSVFDTGTAGPVALPLPTSPDVIGKAILFAKQAITFPHAGPWSDTLRSTRPIDNLPAFADIPHANTRIGAGRPILSFFASADSEEACLACLRRTAADLDCRLFGR
jgi:predicted ATP-grasp superfamily ATP-dependent carboligase